MKKKILGTGNSWSLVITIGLALFNLGIFGLVLISGSEMNKIVKQNFEVDIYLAKEVTGEQIAEFQRFLSSSPFVAVSDGKPLVGFTNREEAGKRFIQETGEDFRQFLGENPLRDAFTIRINDAYFYPDSLARIQTELKKNPLVFEVRYMENLVGAIRENMRQISLFSFGLACILFITVVWLIRNTIKLSVYSQRFLIRTMELVGAKPWFIQKPYIVSMFWRGWFGGVLASLLLFATMRLVNNYVPQIQMLLTQQKTGILLLSLPVVGSLAGIVSTYLIIRKSLGRKLDDLHVY